MSEFDAGGVIQFNLSARVYHRILKLSCTIADLAGSEEIRSVHLAEALHASRSFEVDDGVKISIVLLPVSLLQFLIKICSFG